MQSVILGTAQWGLDYGATNRSGRLSNAVIRSIAEVARTRGVGRLDTAPCYGDAEARIGDLVPDIGVQTKVSAVDRPADQVRSSVEDSLMTLRSPLLDAVLVHDWSTLGAQEQVRLAHELEVLREEGRFTAVGVSG